MDDFKNIFALYDGDIKMAAKAEDEIKNLIDEHLSQFLTKLDGMKRKWSTLGTTDSMSEDLITGYITNTLFS